MSTTGVDTRPAASGPTPQSQTDVVLQGIKTMITSGKLGPGARLPIERDLAIELGVSRGSLREGVRALCIMGVLETRQGDGTYVTALDSSLLLAPMGFLVDLQAPGQRADLFRVRRLLESEAAFTSALSATPAAITAARDVLRSVDELVAAGRVEDREEIFEADLAFHHIIAQASGNAALAALIDALADRTQRIRLWIGLHDLGQVQTAHNDHWAILRAIESRQPDRARLLMDHHLLVVEDSADAHRDDVGLDNSPAVLQ